MFDLDDTIVHGVTGLELAKLLEEMCGNHDKWKEFWEKQKLLSDCNVTYDEAITSLSNCFARAVRGVNIRTFNQALAELSKGIRIKDDFDGFYSWLVQNGFHVFVLTASPQEVFDAIRKYRFEGTYGLILEKNSVYTGGVTLPMTVQNKSKIVSESILKGPTFAFGVSDSVHDMEAFKSLELRFLLGDCSKLSNSWVSVKDFQEIKEILEHTLGAS